MEEWSKNIPEVCEYSSEIIQTTDGGFVFWGCYPDQQSLIRVDALGNFLWKLDNVPSTAAISSTSDNGLLVLVEREDSASPPCQTRDKLFVDKINANGILEWSTQLDNGCVLSTEQECMQLGNRYVLMYISHFTNDLPNTNTYTVETLNLEGERLSKLEHGLSYSTVASSAGAITKALGGEASDEHYTIARILKTSNEQLTLPVTLAIDKVKIN